MSATHRHQAKDPTPKSRCRHRSWPDPKVYFYGYERWNCISVGYLFVFAALHSKARVAGPPPTITTSVVCAIWLAGWRAEEVSWRSWGGKKRPAASIVIEIFYFKISIIVVDSNYALCLTFYLSIVCVCSVIWQFLLGFLLLAHPIQVLLVFVGLLLFMFLGALLSHNILQKLVLLGLTFHLTRLSHHGRVLNIGHLLDHLKKVALID